MNKYNIIFLLILFVLMNCKPIELQNQKLEDSKSYRLNDVSWAKKSISAGQLSTAQLYNLKIRLLKNHSIRLDSIKYLTISYIKPQSTCWYDNYTHIKRPNKTISKSYYQPYSNSELLFLHYDDGYKENLSKHDVDGFVYSYFPEGYGETFCDYMVTLNNYGDFMFKAGHFDIEVANAFKNELENYDRNYRK